MFFAIVHKKQLFQCEYLLTRIHTQPLNCSISRTHLYLYNAKNIMLKKEI